MIELNSKGSQRHFGENLKMLLRGDFFGTVLDIKHVDELKLDGKWDFKSPDWVLKSKMKGHTNNMIHDHWSCICFAYGQMTKKGTKRRDFAKKRFSIVCFLLFEPNMLPFITRRKLYFFKLCHIAFTQQRRKQEKRDGLTD